MKKIEVPKNILEIIKASVTFGSTLAPPEVRYRPETYKLFKRIIQYAGGKWDTSTKSFVFPRGVQAADIKGSIVDTGFAVNQKQLFQEFFTPDALADGMACCIAAHFSFPTGYDDSNIRILEPSAGQGSLVRAMLRRHPGTWNITAIELQDINAREIVADPRVRVIVGDFKGYKLESGTAMDAVIMNPPFACNVWRSHLALACHTLSRRGVLVAVVPATATLEDMKLVGSENKCVYLTGAIENQFEDTKVSVKIVTIGIDPAISDMYLGKFFQKHIAERVDEKARNSRQVSPEKCIASITEKLTSALRELKRLESELNIT